MISGNATPAPGTSAAIIQLLQATNPLKNVDYYTAKKYAELYNSLGEPHLAVKRIVVIQQPQSGVPDGADVLDVATIRNYGIGENVPLYYFLDRGEDDLVDNGECVGDSVRLVNSVGIDANGKKNVLQAFRNLVQSIEPGTTNEEADELVYKQPAIVAAVYEFLNKFLG